MLTMTASRSGRGGVGHMTASRFVFLVASIAPIAELQNCTIAAVGTIASAASS